MRIANHGGENTCPENMLRAADGYRDRIRKSGSVDMLAFLVCIGTLGTRGKSAIPHHSLISGNEDAIYIRCAPVRAGATGTATDGALELDYPDASETSTRKVTDDQDKLKTKAHEAIDARTKIYIVCTEQSAADGVGAEVPLHEAFGSSWG
jgi:hypothetical protein